MVRLYSRLRHAVVLGLLLVPTIAGASLDKMEAASGRGGSVIPCDDPGEITSSTVLVLHSNNTAGSTDIVDSGPSAHPITNTDGVTHASAGPKWGSSGFAGDTSKGFSVADHTDWDFGSGDFTIDFWAYFNTGSMSVMGQGTASAAASSNFYIYKDTRPVFVMSDGSSLYYAYNNAALSTGTYHHIAITRNGNELAFWTDGVKGDNTADVTGVTMNTLAQPLQVMRAYNGDTAEYSGYLDEIRITKGTAIWTADFSASLPDGPYSSTCFDLDGYRAKADVTVDSSLVDSTLTDFPLHIRFASDSGLTTGSETEEVVNGTFDTDTDWVKGTGWAISGGTATATASTGTLVQTFSPNLVQGRLHKVSFDVNSLSGDTFFVRLGGTSTGQITTTGTKSYELVMGTSNSQLNFAPWVGSGLNLDIDNVSVKEIGRDISDYFDTMCGTHDTQDEKYNVAMTTDGYTQVECEAPVTDCINEIAEYHCKIPSVASASDDTYTVYYSGYTPNTEWIGSTEFNLTAADVWDANYLQVFHMTSGNNDADGIKDSSGNNDAVGTSLPTESTGSSCVAGNCIHFDGSADYITMDTGIFANNNTSLSCWMYRDDLSGANEFLMTTTDDYKFYLYGSANGDNSISAQADVSSTVYTSLSDSTKSATTWYNVVGTKSSTAGLTLYIDGVAQADIEAAATGNLDAGAVSSWIGGYGASDSFDGYIDECRATNDVRTAAEIKADYNSGNDTLATYGTPQTNALPKHLKVSTEEFLYSQCESLTGWSTDNSGTGTVTQTTFEGFDIFDLDSGASTGGATRAGVYKDVGTFGSRVVVSFRYYAVDIGTRAADDHVQFSIWNGTYEHTLRIASDGLFVYAGSYVEIGTDENFTCSGTPEGCWQEYTLDITFGTTMDVYLNGKMIADDISSAYANGTADGTAIWYQWGTTTANQQSYIDNIRIGNTLLNE